MQRLVERGKIARARGQQRQPMINAAEQIVGRKQLEPRGSQLDRQRQPVELHADCRKIRSIPIRKLKARVECLGSREQQRHGKNGGERRKRWEWRTARTAATLFGGVRSGPTIWWPT
jgi:hypothetical protein